MPRPALRANAAIWYVPLVFLALIAATPLLLHGCSCGHDMSFHEQSWLDAARQFRHGTLYPAWATSPAWNSGEPRFIFYPPLSWMLGALLTLLLPYPAVPVTFTLLCLAGAALSMFTVARRFTSDNAAFLAAALYAANPYMLFTAFERTAYGELLAAVWIPWIVLGIFKPRVTLSGIACPLALLWLTNAPAAVMGSYTLALLALLRLNHLPTGQSRWSYVRTVLAGVLFGLALPAFYLVPAAYERRFVQTEMVLVPGLSIPQNFLFAHTADAGHDFVNHQASHIAVALIFTAALALLALDVLRRRRGKAALDSSSSPLLSALTVLVVCILFLLKPLSLVVWMHVPEMRFLQFTWRLLLVLAVGAALLLALLLRRIPAAATLILAAIAVPALAFSLGRLYIQPCPVRETPAAVAANFRSSHGVPPTDEYTPAAADNDVLRSNDPGFWLTPDPSGFAPGSSPNPNEARPDVDFGEPPIEKTRSTPAPHHLDLNLPAPSTLVLNLRDYTNWQIVRNGSEHPVRLHRDDGLVAVALPAGHSIMDIRWQTGRDREFGALISLSALSGFVFCIRRSRRIVQ